MSTRGWIDNTSPDAPSEPRIEIEQCDRCENVAELQRVNTGGVVERICDECAYPKFKQPCNCPVLTTETREYDGKVREMFFSVLDTREIMEAL